MPFARSWRPTSRRVFGVIAAVAVSASIVGVMPATSAYATKSADTAAAAKQAQQKLDALGVAADKAVEAYDTAQSKLGAATTLVKAQQAALAAAQREVAAAKVGIQALAAAEYERGPANTAITYLLSDDPASVLQRAAMLERVNLAQTASLTKVINANRDLEQAKTRADQSLAAQQAASAQVAASKAAADKAVAAQQAVLNTLSAQLQKQQAAEAAAARAAQVQQQAASRANARSNVNQAAAAVPPAARGSVSAVLAYAYAQLGKPYRYGGAGPGSFDCSGLAMRAWAAAGVSLSHSTVAQQHQGRPVSMSALQPGDLVFWGSPAYHVGIYVGGGKVLDAPHTGTVVQIQAIWGHPSGAVRP